MNATRMPGWALHSPGLFQASHTVLGIHTAQPQQRDWMFITHSNHALGILVLHPRPCGTSKLKYSTSLLTTTAAASVSGLYANTTKRKCIDCFHFLPCGASIS